MNDEEELVAVSPRHSVRVGPEYAAFVHRAPSKDLVLRTLTRREANGMPLMSADIVIAGVDIRQKYPLAARYPLHFRKTYYPGRLHGDPREELARQAQAADILGIPPPIGATHAEFRSCLLPGTPYQRLSPFGVEPEESNIARARELELARAAGLWWLLEEGFTAIERLHERGLAHGDAELHNFIVCANPLETIVIDFEAAAEQGSMSEEAWEKRCAADLVPVLKEAIYLQCRIGRQPSALGERACDRISQLFKRPERFQREIGENSTPPA